MKSGVYEKVTTRVVEVLENGVQRQMNPESLRSMADRRDATSAPTSDGEARELPSKTRKDCKST
jgi:hypothetical protein